MHLDSMGSAELRLRPRGTGKGWIAELFDVVVDGLHSRLAGEGGERVGFGVEGFGGVEAGEVVVEMAVGGEELFGTAVVGFEVGVGEWPRGRDAAFVVDDAEVFSAEAEECGAVDLGLAADVVGLLGVKGLVVLVEPDVFGVIAVVEEDGGGVPVEFFLGKKRAALEDEDAFARLGQMERECAAPCSGSDDDGVVVVGHGAPMAAVGDSHQDPRLLCGDEFSYRASMMGAPVSARGIKREKTVPWWMGCWEVR